jgi:hypothetical protein
MIEILTDFEEMTMGSGKGLEWITKCCPCLRPVLMKLFDISQGILLFPAQYPSSHKTEWIRKLHVHSTFPYYKKETQSAKCVGYMNSWLRRYLLQQENFRYEPIISQHAAFF